MKTTKKAALAAASSALLLGLTVAQTVNADTYTVQNGDSFFGIASQYGVDPYQLAAENGMTIWSTIVPGGSLEVSGATTAVEETTEVSSSEVTATDSDATWNRYPVGQCTWGVKEVAPWASNWWGNGGDWAGSAASQGYAVGSTQEYSGIIIQHAREILVNAHPDVKAMLSFDEKDVTAVDKRLKRGLSSFSSEGFTFRNGGKLEGLSAGSNFTDPSKIHVIGRGGNMFGDEASDISPIALGHMGRREFESDDGRKLIMYLISNPRSLNNFYDFMTNEDLADDEFVMWLDVVTAIEEGSIRYTKEELMRSQFTITEDSIRENLLCEFPTERSAFFDSSPNVLDSFDPKSEEYDYFIGVDSAYKGADSIQVTVTVVDKHNHFTVLDTKDIKPAEWIDGITAIEIVDKIVTLANRLNAKAIGIDAGGGAHIVQPLKMRRLGGKLKCSVYDINFGGKPTEIKVLAKDPSAEYAYNRRAEMHLMLRGMMEAQRVSFVKSVWDSISRQMSFVSEIQKPEDRLVKIRPKSEIKKLLKHSPDELDSVLLSLHVAELFYLGGS